MERTDDPVLHFQEARQFGHRQPQQAEENLRRQRHRELPGEVDLPVVDEAVDQVVDQTLHRLGELRDALGGEQRVEDPAELAMLWRVQLERDERADVAEVAGIIRDE